MIGIINYGLGNVLAFQNILKNLAFDSLVVEKKEQLDSCHKLILPGVGHFDKAMSLLNQSNLREKLDYLVLQKEIPILGVCVGMQIMMDSSEEGSEPGLGWISGNVVKFVNNENLIVPHMGWNNVQTVKEKTIFCENFKKDFYFLHSYHVVPDDADSIIFKSFYGEEFISGINRDLIFGTQFHPEKSHNQGTSLLKQFCLNA